MSIVPLFIPINEIDRYFYNRKKDIKEIEFYLNSLESNISQRLLICGPRGVGKTFLLQKIKQDAKDNFLVAYLDLSLIASNKLNAQTVLLELLDRMNDAIYGKLKSSEKIIFAINKFLDNNLKLKDHNFSEGTQIAQIPIPKSEENYSKISKFVMEYPQKVVENNEDIDGFIIIIDEFQLLKKLEGPEDFFWMLRGFNQFQSNVSYVMSGSVSSTSDVIEMLNGPTGAFGGRMIQIDIEPFSKEETRSYFNDRFSEIQFTEDGFDRLYEYAKGIPMYINSFYNNLSADEIYDSKAIDYIFLNNMNQILVMWIRIWGTLNEYEKCIVCGMLNEDGVTWTYLNDNLPMSVATLNKYLKTLQDKGIIRFFNNRYSLEDLMLETWLNRQKEIYGVYPY